MQELRDDSDRNEGEAHRNPVAHTRVPHLLVTPVLLVTPAEAGVQTWHSLQSTSTVLQWLSPLQQPAHFPRSELGRRCVSCARMDDTRVVKRSCFTRQITQIRLQVQ
jgi:hypothetical protein